jgi:predicted CoA-binding protein
VSIGAKALWLQSGIENDQAEAIAVAAGLDYLSDRCIMVEHRKLGL